MHQAMALLIVFVLLSFLHRVRDSEPVAVIPARES
jgi:hypothetical protein